MTVKDLNRNQMFQLKQKYMKKKWPNISDAELGDANFVVLNETIFDEYADTIFSPDDFEDNTLEICPSFITEIEKEIEKRLKEKGL